MAYVDGRIFILFCLEFCSAFWCFAFVVCVFVFVRVVVFVLCRGVVALLWECCAFFCFFEVFFGIIVCFAFSCCLVFLFSFCNFVVLCVLFSELLVFACYVILYYLRSLVPWVYLYSVCACTVLLRFVLVLVNC